MTLKRTLALLLALLMLSVGCDDDSSNDPKDVVEQDQVEDQAETTDPDVDETDTEEDTGEDTPDPDTEEDLQDDQPEPDTEDDVPDPDTAEDVPEDLPPAGDPCDDYGVAYCNKLDDCAPFFVDVVFGSLDTCAERTAMDCERASVAPGALIDRAAADACVAALANGTCEDLFHTTLDACQPKGELADGVECGDGAQCQSGFCYEAGDDCGVCAVEPGEGDSCDVMTCSVGLECVEGGCYPKGDVGEDCSVTECLEMLDCVDDDGTMTCEYPADLDEDCNEDSMGLPNCDSFQGLICLEGTCAEVNLAGADDPCGVIESSWVICNGAYNCNMDPSTMSGTCEAKPLDGEACDSDAGIECLRPATCVEGVCTLPAETTCGL